MSRITNALGLPEAFVRAVSTFDGEYDSEGSYLTASSICDPPRIRILKERYRDKLIEDASERVYIVGGQAMHKVLEAAARPEDIVERRFSFNFAYTDPPTKVSAKIDLYEPDAKRLSDWKETSAWTVLRGDRLPEWEAQLNVGALLMRRSGYEVEHIQIVARLRDWSWSDAQRSADYPKQAIVVIPLELWPLEKTERFICDRILAHKAADAAAIIPDCTSEERWQKPTIYAVMKPGRKSSLKNCDTKADAESLCAATPGAFVQERRGESIRCSRYCVVGKLTGHCEQWEAERQAASSDTEAA